MSLDTREYTWDEVIALARHHDEKETYKDQLSHGGRGGFSDMTWEESVEALTFGWKDRPSEIVDLGDEMADVLRKKINDYRGSHMYDVFDSSGGYVDVERYIDGDPECMIESYVNQDVLQGKALKILINYVVNGDVSTRQIMERGAHVMAAIEAVMSTGMNVELWAGDSYKVGRSTRAEIVLVKGYEDLVDPDVLAYVVGHPAMMRRTGFFLNEVRHTVEHCTNNDVYGAARTFPKEVHDQFDLVVETYGEGQDNADAIFDKLVLTSSDDRVSEYV